MFNARESFNMLANAPELDGLLNAAQKQAQKLAGRHGAPDTSAADKLAELDERAEAVRKEAAAAAGGLRDLVEAKHAQRAEKVAIARHILGVASRLVA